MTKSAMTEAEARGLTLELEWLSARRRRIGKKIRVLNRTEGRPWRGPSSLVLGGPWEVTIVKFGCESKFYHSECRCSSVKEG